MTYGARFRNGSNVVVLDENTRHGRVAVSGQVNVSAGSPVDIGVAGMQPSDYWDVFLIADAYFADWRYDINYGSFRITNLSSGTITFRYWAVTK